MLTFILKKEWFDKIKSGKKTHEYREMSDLWRKKLIPKNFWMSVYDNLNIPITDDTRFCKFHLGYPPTRKDPEKARERVLYAEIIKITANVNGQKTDLVHINPNCEDVFDIEFILLND